MNARVIYETFTTDLEDMQATFKEPQKPALFSIPSLKSSPIDLRSLDPFEKTSLIPHIRCGDYSKQETLEMAELAKKRGFKQVFLISGDKPHSSQKGLTSCQAIPSYHGVGLEVGSCLDIYAPCLKTEIEKAQKKAKAGASYLVTQVVFLSEEIEKRLLEIKGALHHTGVKIVPALSHLGDIKKDSLLLKKICPTIPQEIFSGKQDIHENNKKAVDLFQRLFNSDTVYLIQYNKTTLGNTFD